MAAVANGVSAPPGPQPAQSPNPASGTAPAVTKTDTPKTDTPPANTNPPKLSNAELKAKAKAEKAARRAQAKEAKAAVAPPGGASAAGQQSDGKPAGKPGKGKQDAHQPADASAQGRSGLQRRMSTARHPLTAAVERDVRSAIPDCFSHIAMAKRIPTSQAHKDVHPAVLALGQQMATFTVRDSIARLKGTLLAFRKVCFFFIETEIFL